MNFKSFAAAVVLALSLVTTAYADNFSETTAFAVTTSPVEKYETSEAPVMTAPAEEYTYDVPAYELRGEQGRGEILNLEGYFYKNGYPNFISYIFAVDKFITDEAGNIAVIYEAGLTELTQENKDYILDLAAEDCYVEFFQAKYSYNELDAIQQEIRELKDDNIAAFLAYDFVDVTVFDYELFGEYNKLFTEKYGDRVTVTVASDDMITGGLPVAGGGFDGGYAQTIPEIGVAGSVPVVSEDKADSPNVPLIIGISAALVIAIASGAVLLVRQRVKISADGTAVAAKRLSTADVEELVRESEEKPSEELKERIMREIK